MRIPSVVPLCAVPGAAPAQTVDSLDLGVKLRFHAKSVYNPWSMAGLATYEGVLEEIGTPREWGQGSGACGETLST